MPDDSDKSDEEDSDEDIDDATAEESAALRRKLSSMLPDQRKIVWERKKRVKSPFHKPPL